MNGGIEETVKTLFKLTCFLTGKSCLTNTSFSNHHDARYYHYGKIFATTISLSLIGHHSISTWFESTENLLRFSNQEENLKPGCTIYRQNWIKTFLSAHEQMSSSWLYNFEDFKCKIRLTVITCLLKSAANFKFYLILQLIFGWSIWDRVFSVTYPCTHSDTPIITTHLNYHLNFFIQNLDLVGAWQFDLPTYISDNS